MRCCRAVAGRRRRRAAPSPRPPLFLSPPPPPLLGILAFRTISAARAPHTHTHTQNKQRSPRSCCHVFCKKRRERERESSLLFLSPRAQSELSRLSAGAARARVGAEGESPSDCCGCAILGRESAASRERGERRREEPLSSRCAAAASARRAQPPGSPDSSAPRGRGPSCPGDAMPCRPPGWGNRPRRAGPKALPSRRL